MDHFYTTDHALILPPVANAQYPCADPAIPRDSPQGVVLVDAGRLADGVHGDADDAVRAARPRDRRPGEDFVRNLNNYAGFKRLAAVVLYTPHPDGMKSDDALDFIDSDDFLTTTSIGMLFARSFYNTLPTRPAVGHAINGWTALARPCGLYKVRIDAFIETGPVGGVEDVFGIGEINGVLHRPYTIRNITVGLNTNFAVREQLHRVGKAVRTTLHAYIDTPITEFSSDRVFLRLVGLHVWATPVQGIVQYHVGGGPCRRDRWPIGIVDAGVRDGRCMARSLVTGFNVGVHTHLHTSVTAVLRSAVKGASVDVETAHIVGGTRLEQAIVRLADAQDRLARSTASAKSDHTKKTFDRLQGTIETELSAMMTGRTLHQFDLSHALFRGPVLLDDDTVAQIRAAIAPAQCKLNVWVNASADSVISMRNHDTGATLAFLEAGGRILNVLEADEHVWVISNVNAVNSAALRRRVCCELCGFVAVRTPSTAVQCAQTLIALHQERGCVEHTAVSMTLPLSPQNIRQLTIRNFRMRWPLSIHVSITETRGVFGFAIMVNTPCGWREARNVPAWHTYFDRHSNPDNLTTFADLAFVSGAVPSDPVIARDTFTDVASLVDALMTETSLLRSGVFLRIPRLHHAPVDARTGACFFCRYPLAGRPRSELQSANTYAVEHFDDESDTDSLSDDDGAVHRAPVSGVGIVEAHCPSTGAACWAHTVCNDAANYMTWPNNSLLVDVSSANAMNGIVEAVMQLPFIDRVCAGRIPSLQTQAGKGVQAVTVYIRSNEMTDKAGGKRLRQVQGGVDDVRAFSVRFRSPLAHDGATNGGVLSSLDASPASHAKRNVAWGDRGLATTGLNPLLAATAISFARAVLLDSASVSLETITSLTSKESLDFYSRMTLGGRLLTGCAVLHPPLPDARDRSTVRMWLDVTSMYPSILVQHALPSSEHTDRILADFTSSLSEGIAFVLSTAAQQVAGPDLCMSIEMSGSFPASVHAGIAQFPPLFERLSIGRDMYTPFQRTRLRLPLNPVARTVAHLLPIVSFPMFIAEARRLLLLGFVPTSIGVVRGCKASNWARAFAQRAQINRRRAMRTGDTVTSDDVKRMMNSVIGATNQDTSRHTSLRSVRSNEIVVGTLDTRGSASGKRAYKRQFADDPRFTGRVLACGGVTLVERSAAPGRPHVQQTVFSLAVQAYARCAHLDLWYGTRVGSAPGVLDAFPHARLLYGNTDSLMIEVSLSDEQRASGDTDARHVLYRVLRDRMDISNVPSTSTFWNGAPAQWKTEAAEHMGEWGRVKEETGMCGIEAFVVNGPNRWGASIAQIPGDTPQSYVGEIRDTVLKTLSKAFIGASLEDYASNWANGVGGACVWGNTACLVGVDGKQWPIGSELPAVLDAMSWCVPVTTPRTHKPRTPSCIDSGVSTD